MNVNDENILDEYIDTLMLATAYFLENYRGKEVDLSDFINLVINAHLSSMIRTMYMVGEDDEIALKEIKDFADKLPETIKKILPRKTHEH